MSNFHNLCSIYSWIIYALLILLATCTSTRTDTSTIHYDKNKKTKVGIVGAAGFIGSVLGNYLSEVGFNVIGYDRKPLLKVQNFQIIKKTSYQIDNHEIASLDVVVYLGGVSRERTEVMSTEYILGENVNDILALVRKMKPHQLLIFASTSGILEGSGKFPMNESRHIHISKLDAYCGSLFLREQTLKNFYSNSREKPSMIGIRFGTVVASPKWRYDSFIHSAFKSAYSVGIIKLNNPDVYGAYLWNKDLVQAISKIIYQRESFQNVFEIYHLQTVSASMLQVATAVSLITDAQLEIIESHEPSSLYGLSMDSTLFENTFMFKPNGNLLSMLKEYDQDMPESDKHHPNITIGVELNESIDCSEKCSLHHDSNQQEVKNSRIDDVVIPNNFKEKLQFYVMTLGHRKDCGGCRVLVELISVLDEMGYYVIGINNTCPNHNEIELLKILNRTAVFIYPEVIHAFCNYKLSNVTHVRWILAPLQEMYTHTWGRDDLVFTYRPGIIHNHFPEISNNLMVMENPKPGDETDIPDSVFYNKERSGILWTQRKAKKFHKHFEYIHNHTHTNLTATQNERLSVAELRNYEYFISYDPYSYWSFLAAMSGAVSIVCPLHGVTKENWTKSVFIYEYLQAIGKNIIPGIAYGWVESEIEFARATMHELRSVMVNIKKMGEEISVSRFVRDCYRHVIGMRSNFEAARLVSDFFPM